MGCGGIRWFRLCCLLSGAIESNAHDMDRMATDLVKHTTRRNSTPGASCPVTTSEQHSAVSQTETDRRRAYCIDELHPRPRSQNAFRPTSWWAPNGVTWATQILLFRWHAASTKDTNNDIITRECIPLSADVVYFPHGSAGARTCDLYQLRAYPWVGAYCNIRCRKWAKLAYSGIAW